MRCIPVFCSSRQTSRANPAMLLATAALGLVFAAGQSAVAKTRFTPHFETVMAKPANVRRGPGTDYPIKWIYVRRWEPVEIFEEYGNWRRIRDWQGDNGWMLGALLTGRRRTGLVEPWSHGPPVPLRGRPSHRGRVLAWLEPRVMVQLMGCDGIWCRSNVRSFSGYIRVTHLWGAYPGERF